MKEHVFKFLDSYGKADREIFFGRDREINELYDLALRGRILIIYGISGTGKSSLVNCGLANEFIETDWMPINIRRGSDINLSLEAALRQNCLTKVKTEIGTLKVLRSIYLDHFKPIYLIFDQLEELFIFGSEDEKKLFIDVMKDVYNSNINCHLIFIIREEYLANLSMFEERIPEFFSNRLRVEKVGRKQASEIIEGPCRVKGIAVVDGFTQRVLDNLSPDGRQIELTHLQVYLDRLYHRSLNTYGPPIRFDPVLVEESGELGDLLGDFLEERVAEFDDSEAALATLKAFVSSHGTKKPLNIDELNKSLAAFGKNLPHEQVTALLQHFVALRILRERDDAGRYELSHDALALKVFEKISVVEKEIMEVMRFLENAAINEEKRGVLLTEDDLSYLQPYRDKVIISNRYRSLIDKSEKVLQKTRLRRQRIRTGITAAVLVALAGLTVWALLKRYDAVMATQAARSAEVRMQGLYLSTAAKELSRTHPNQALRLAEFGYELNPDSKVQKNMLDIFFENCFYTEIGFNEANYRGLEVSKDGRLVLGFGGRKLQIYSMDGTLVQEIILDYGRIDNAKFSPKGDHIAVANNCGVVGIWAVGKKDCILKFPSREILDNISLAFSPDGRTLAIASRYEIEICDWHDGTSIAELSIPEIMIKNTQFSPDGRLIAYSKGNVLTLMDLNGRIVQSHQDHQADIYSIRFFDGGGFMTAGFDSRAILYDSRGRKTKEYATNEAGVYDAVFIPGKQKIALSCQSGLVIMDSADNQSVSIPSPFYLMGMGLLANGKLVCRGMSIPTLVVWDVDPELPKSMTGHYSQVSSSEFSRDGNQLLSASNTNGLVQVRDANGNTLASYSPGQEYGCNFARYMPDGSFFCGGKGLSYTYSPVTSEMKIMARFFSSDQQCRNGDVSPDGRYCVAQNGGMETIISRSDGTIAARIRTMGEANDCRFSGNGDKVIIAADYRVGLLIVDTAGTVIRTIKKNEHYSTASFSPDGQYIAAGTTDGEVFLFTSEGVQKNRFKVHNGWINDLRFSPDGKLFATCGVDNVIHVWNLNGEEVHRLTGHRSKVNSICFSADGRHILSASSDSTIRLWNFRPTIKEFLQDPGFPRLSAATKLEYGLSTIEELISSNNLPELHSTLKLLSTKYEESTDSTSKSVYFGQLDMVSRRLFQKTHSTVYFSNLLNNLEMRFNNDGSSATIDSLDSILQSITTQDPDLVLTSMYFTIIKSQNRKAEDSLLVDYLMKNQINLVKMAIKIGESDSSYSRSTMQIIAAMMAMSWDNSRFGQAYQLSELWFNSHLANYDIKTARLFWTIANILVDKWDVAESMLMKYKDMVDPKTNEPYSEQWLFDFNEVTRMGKLGDHPGLLKAIQILSSK